MTLNGKYVVVEAVAHEILEAPVKVYNFEVAVNHTYFVGKTAVGVHNADYALTKVKFNGQDVDIYRGGTNFTARDIDVKIDKATGLVQPTRGLSLNVDPNKLTYFGGAHKITSIPGGLKIIQHGTRDPGHFEIVPKYAMSMEEFQRLLGLIKFE